MSAAPRFERRVPVRFAHCDPAGIVFFPQYFVWFNGLVEDWVTDALGIGYAELIGPRRVGLPTVSLQSEFRAVARLGEALTLGLAVERLGTRSLALALDARGDDGVVRACARQVLVTTDLATHRAITIPPDLRAAIERFIAHAPPGDPA